VYSQLLARLLQGVVDQLLKGTEGNTFVNNITNNDNNNNNIKRLLQGVVDQLLKGTEGNTFVKGLLSAEYPRVRQLFLRHLQEAQTSSDAGIAGALGAPERVALLSALQVVSKGSTKALCSIKALPRRY